MLRRLAAWALALALAGAAPAIARAQTPPASGSLPALPDMPGPDERPSRSQDFRSQRDSVGYAVRADQMARVWEWSTLPPAPDSLGPAPAPGVAAVLAPHDDYAYAARVYRRALPLITARTVIVIGVFHGYRKAGVRDRLVFESYRAWAAPDGPVPVSPLRTDLLDRLAEEDVLVDSGMQAGEHSVEALVFWLRHQRSDLEIVPILVPAASFERFEALARHLGAALTDVLHDRGWVLGRDVAIAISSDAVHYGADFKHTPFGADGPQAYRRAVARDRALLTGPLAGPLTRAKVRALFGTFVDPRHPDDYRLTWCGRFALPFGLLLLDQLALANEQIVVGHPLAYSTSIAAPPLPAAEIGLGTTAPATPAHFVGQPAAAFTLEAPRRR